jgi:hypothetical protein
VAIVPPVLIEALSGLLAQLKGGPAPAHLAWDTATKNRASDMLAYSPERARIHTASQPEISTPANIPGWATADADAQAQTVLRPNRAIVIQLYMPRLRRVPELVFALAHEYGHVNFLHSNGFAISEAAPFLTADEYVLLKWHGEFVAFLTQQAITAEIITNCITFTPPEPSYKPLMRAELAREPIIVALEAGRAQRARQLIRSRYARSLLISEYQAHSTDTSPPELGIAGRVAAFKASNAWPDAAFWSP